LWRDFVAAPSSRLDLALFPFHACKPDVQISRVRLSLRPSGFRSRHFGTPLQNLKEANRFVEIPVRDLGEPGASFSGAAHQPVLDSLFDVAVKDRRK
jgi:hypothetical protein